MPTYEGQAHWQSLHPTMLLFGLGKILRSSVAAIVAGGVVAFNGHMELLAMILIFSIVMPSIALVLRFASYRYRLEDGQITIREGILSRKQRNIPVRRIHNVNVHQSLVGKWFGIVQLELETAGGASSEATLPALSEADALTIKNYIASESSDVLSHEEEAAPADFEHSVSLSQLVIAGATTNKIGLIFMGLAFLFQYTEEAILKMLPGWVEDIAFRVQDLSRSEPGKVALAALILLFALLFVAWILSIVTTIIRWYGFKLWTRKEEIKTKAGLLTVREQTIPLKKVQALKCRISAFRRLFNLVQIRVQTAGHAGMESEQRRENDLMLPIGKVREVGKYLTAVWQDVHWDQVNWTGVHPFTRTQHIRKLLTILAVLGCGFYLLDVSFVTAAKIHGAFLTVAIVPAFLIGHFTYKQTAYAVDAKYIYIRSGFLSLFYWVIPISKIQNVGLRQSPFQRWRGLASLVVDVAGGSTEDAVVPNIPVGKAWSLFNIMDYPRGEDQTKN